MDDKKVLEAITNWTNVTIESVGDIIADDLHDDDFDEEEIKTIVKIIK